MLGPLDIFSVQIRLKGYFHRPRREKPPDLMRDGCRLSVTVEFDYGFAHGHEMLATLNWMHYGMGIRQ